MKKINIIYFECDQYNLLPQFFNILNKHAEFLRKNPNYKVIIEGHTGKKGTPEYNIALGERRANSVKIYLQNQGVTENQVLIISYGKEKLDFSKNNEEKEQNRKVVLIY